MKKRIIYRFLCCALALTTTLAASSCSEDQVKETDMVKKANEYIALNINGINDRYKGTYHLTPQLGRLGDPNGFIYFKGQYHMFFQANPYDPGATPTCWGHAVSDDLISWKHLGIVLAPDHDYDCDGCWSGSAIAVGDRLYLVYTGNHDRNGLRVQTQCLAYSDDGVNFVKYANNPLIGADKIPAGTSLVDFRDPYIWKHEDKYYLLVGTMEQGAAKVLLYESYDLFNWTFKNNLLRRTSAGFCWECPSFVSFGDVDLFSCSPVDYPHNGYAFVNYNSCIYALGKIDYSTGVMDAGAFVEIDRGLDFYASQIIYGANDKIILSSWMNSWGRTWVPAELGDGWEGMLCLPRELSLKDGKLYQKPVTGIDAYCKNTITKSASVTEKTTLDGVNGRCVRLKIVADMKSSTYFKISMLSDETYDTYVSYDKTRGLVKLCRKNNKYIVSADERDGSNGTTRFAEYEIKDDKLVMDIFIDKSSIEVFFGDGEMTMSALTYNPETADGIFFESVGETLVTVEKSDIVIG